MNDCLFCKIIQGKIPSERIFETENIVVIKDIAPKATIHYLIIPKKHIKDIQSFDKEDFSLASEIFETAQHLSKKIEKASDFRLVVNSGSKAGQCIFHLHMHFLAGAEIPLF